MPRSVRILAGRAAPGLRAGEADGTKKAACCGQPEVVTLIPELWLNWVPEKNLVKFFVESHNFLAVHVMVSGQETVNEIEGGFSIQPESICNCRFVRYCYLPDKSFQCFSNHRPVCVIHAFQYIHNFSQDFCCCLRTGKDDILCRFRQSRVILQKVAKDNICVNDGHAFPPSLSQKRTLLQTSGKDSHTRKERRRLFPALRMA